MICEFDQLHFRQRTMSKNEWQFGGQWIAFGAQIQIKLKRSFCQRASTLPPVTFDSALIEKSKKR